MVGFATTMAIPRRSLLRAGAAAFLPAPAGAEAPAASAASSFDPWVEVDVANLVRNNVYVYGIRGEGKSATHRAEAFMQQKRFDATKIHTHTFALDDLPTAIRYAKDRVEDAIKVVVKAKMDAAHKVAAE